MASLLRPVTLEDLHRRSSSNSIHSIPRLFPNTPSRDDQSEGLLRSPSPTDSLPPLSPLVNAQLPDYASRMIIPRHDDKVSVINTDVYHMPLPYNTSLATSPQKSSLSVSDEDNCIMERIRWRLASSFFAYFLLGWGDGGQ